MSDVNRNERLAEYVKEKVSEFISRESNHSSLITVTRVDLDNSSKNGTILISVLPEEKEEEVINFLRRRRSDVRDYLKSNIRSRMIPFIDFIIDKGEKNRQLVDELLK